jgi:hypothetical protein
MGPGRLTVETEIRCPTPCSAAFVRDKSTVSGPSVARFRLLASLLEGYTWHCNRHTFASRLVMAGVDLLTVQKLGGCRALSVVHRYAHLALDHVLAAVERPSVPELGLNLDSTPSADTSRTV